jgi:hypothetical protein
MPGRAYNAGSSYRYGMNGMEKDDEVSGPGNSNTAEFWQYDSRTGRRWNIDPVDKPWMSPYHAFSNKPIWNIDPNGASDHQFDEQEDGSWKKREGVKNDGGEKNHTYAHKNGDVSYYNGDTKQLKVVKAGEVATKRNEYKAYRKDVNKGVQKTGEIINNVGDVIATVGYVAAPFTGGSSLVLAGVGEGISVAGKVIKDAAEVSDEGLTPKTITDITIDAAFEIVPAPIEQVIKKSNLDEPAKMILKTQLGKLKLGTEKAVEVSRKDEEVK